MANYIGNQPSYGEFKRLDSISSSFNGSTTTFNLTYNSVSTPVGDASQLIVSLNGIIQEPLNSYTLGVGGSSIVFSSAPVSGDTCFIMYIGGAGGTVTTISDGSVTASKLDASLKDYYEDEFTANGSTTDFTLSRDSIGVNQLLVTIDGIVQPTSAYTASGTTLTISPALPNGTNIRVVHMGAKAGVFVPQSGSVGLNELDLVGVDTRYYTQTAADATFETISNVALKAPIANPSFTGNVGIGTSSPTNKLHVVGTAKIEGSTLDLNDAGTFTISQNTAASALILRTATLSYLRFDTNGANERMRIDSNGSVGIGTTSPLTLMHLSSASPRITITDTDTGADHRINADSSVGNLAFDIDYNSETAAPSAIFNIKGSEKLRIDSDGKVGINQSNPLFQLDITRSSGNTDVARIKGNAGNAFIRFQDSDSSSDFTVGSDDNGPTGSGSFVIYDRNASSYRWRLDSAGRVTTPFQPAFMARPGGDYYPTAGSSQVFQLGNVIKNQGNHWASNVFTCPVDGMYLVTFTAYYNPGNYGSYVGAYITTTAGTYYSFAPPGNDVTVTMSVVIPQAANDGIRFYTYSGSSSNQLRAASSASIILLS